jgi:hypothetical protein
MKGIDREKGSQERNKEVEKQFGGQADDVEHLKERKML